MNRYDLSATVRRSLAEFVVIVIGVLVALAVDDWRQTGDERRIEREAYIQLFDDLGLDSTDLANARMLSGNRARAALLLLERTAAAPTEINGVRDALADALPYSSPAFVTQAADSFGTELLALYQTLVFDPNRSAMASLIGGGDLRLLQDPEIRTALVSYSSTVDERNEIRAVTRDAQIRFRMYLDSHDITVLDLLLKPDLDQVLLPDPRFPVEIKAVAYRALIQADDLSAIEEERAPLRDLVAARLRQPDAAWP